MSTNTRAFKRLQAAREIVDKLALSPQETQTLLRVIEAAREALEDSDARYRVAGILAGGATE